MEYTGMFDEFKDEYEAWSEDEIKSNDRYFAKNDFEYYVFKDDDFENKKEESFIEFICGVNIFFNEKLMDKEQLMKEIA